MADETYEVDEIIEEYVKEKKGVKDILREMKNISELMIDLAYSAVLFDNDQLAEEVIELEEEVNKLRYQIEIGAMLSARTPEDAGKLAGILRVAATAERISNSAKELAELVLRDVELHPALQAALEEADEIVDRVVVKEGSELAGKTVGDLKENTKYAMDVIALKRKKSWMLDVPDETAIKGGDTLIASGFKESVSHLQEMAG